MQLVFGLLPNPSEGVAMVSVGDHWKPLFEFIKTLP